MKFTTGKHLAVFDGWDATFARCSPPACLFSWSDRNEDDILGGAAADVLPMHFSSRHVHIRHVIHSYLASDPKWNLVQQNVDVQVTNKMLQEIWLNKSAFLPPVNIVHEEQSASRFHHVHRCINILDPGGETKVSEWPWFSFDERASHCPEHGLCGHVANV